MKNSIPDIECQLDSVFGSGTPVGFWGIAKIYGMRLASALRRRLYARGILPQPAEKINPDCTPQEISEDTVGADIPNKLAPGDWVMILPYEDIRKTLDDRNRCNGLEFMEGMRKFCGQKTRVLKPAKTIFDSRITRMIRVRESYLLEGAYCDGRGTFNYEGCDRACFFFWKKDWLRKIVD